MSASNHEMPSGSPGYSVSMGTDRMPAAEDAMSENRNGMSIRVNKMPAVQNPVSGSANALSAGDYEMS